MRAERLALYYELAGWEVKREEKVTRRGRKYTTYEMASRTQQGLRQITFTGFIKPTSPRNMRMTSEGGMTLVCLPEQAINLLVKSQTARGLNIFINPRPKSVRVGISSIDRPPVFPAFSKILHDEEGITLALQALRGEPHLGVFCDWLTDKGWLK